MRVVSIALGCIFVACAAAQDQDKEALRRELMNRHFAEYFEKMAQPPKFETEGDRLRLLANRSIRSELGIGVKEWLDVQKIQKTTRAELTRFSNEHPRTVDKPFNMHFFEEALTMQEIEAVSKILSAAQLTRLGQLVHYVEIAHIGLPMAIADGNLGSEIGVYENQISNIKTKGTNIVEESKALLSTIRSTTHQKILALLPRECQDKAEDVLGPFFEIGDWTAGERDFRLTEGEELVFVGKQATASQNETPVDDIESEADHLLVFLRHSEVWRELNLSSEQLYGLSEARKRWTEARKSAQVGGGAAADLLAELLLPHQHHRLQQLFHYRELRVSGYATALTVGRVGRKIGVPTQSASELRLAIQNLENTCEQQCKVVDQQTHTRILQLLSSDQRRRADALLGNYFAYIDGSISAKRDIRELFLKSDKKYR